MRFSDTDLPDDMKVFRAFKIWNATPNNNGFDLGVAGVLSQAGAPRDTVCLALLSQTPPAAQGEIAKNFGPRMLGLVKSAQRQAAGGYKSLLRAPEEVRLLALASSYLFLFHFETKAKEVQRKMGATGTIHTVPSLDTGLYNTFVTRIAGSTSSPLIEGNLKKKLAEVLPLQDEMLDTVRRLTGKPGRFEDSGLLDRPSVRALYNELALDDSVLPENFNAAVKAGRILSGVPRRTSPSVVIAALADIAKGPFSETRYPPESLTQGASLILQDRSIHTVTTPNDIRDGTPQFAQIVLADAVVRLGAQTKRSRRELNDPGMIKYAFNNAAIVERKMEGVVRPAASAALSPALEALFVKKLDAFSRMLDPHRPILPRLPGGGAERPRPDRPRLIFLSRKAGPS